MAIDLTQSTPPQENDAMLKSNDPLLLTAKTVMLFMGAILAFTAIMIGIGAGSLLTVERAEMIGKLADAGAPASGYAVLIVMFVLIFATLALAIYFIRATWQLVRSVEQGDPFVEANADRLRTMGWTSLTIQFAIIGATASARWLATFVQDVEQYGDLGINGAGFLLPLVLFILARVFRLGTQMRTDLEGTV